MRAKLWLVGVAGGLWGCGGSSESEAAKGSGINDATVRSFEGTYALTASNRNPSSCDDDGLTTFVTMVQMNFVMTNGSFLGTRYLVLASCSDAKHCEMNARGIESGEYYSAANSVTFDEAVGPDELAGFRVAGGLASDGVCTGREYVKHRLIRSGDTLRVESRSSALPDAPEDEARGCIAELPKQENEAQGRPCTSLTTFSVRKAGPLP